MTGAERGFLLLTSHLGDPERRIMTVAQLRTLAKRARAMEPPEEQRDMCPEDLAAMGYDRPEAERILRLLSQQDQLDWYLHKAAKHGCVPITRVSEIYPAVLHRSLGLDCPGVLWGKGDLSLLGKPAVSLVGSRDLAPENRDFAAQAGKQAAMQGLVLVSGNARGADRQAQESCLMHGGSVISIVADRLQDCPERENLLYLSEDGFDLDFSSQRAISRNRIIHTMGRVVLVAQCHYQKGGTWTGTVQNLRHNWQPVFCFADGSPAVRELVEMGAQAIEPEQLADLRALAASTPRFL